ncbi:MAG: glycosyltransferase family 9 protein [Alphaproteobacteria bacterium]|nr:glycosyltransferase family 9 protein [Alphaproteobacteria bacterium]
MNVLFVTASRIGDAVLSTGLLAEIMERHPEAHVTIACGPAAAPLFYDFPNLVALIELEKRPLLGHWFALWWRALPTAWDLIVDLRNSALVYGLLTRRRRVFRGGTGHQVERLATVSLSGRPQPPRLWLGAAEEAAAAALVPPGPPVLALGPTANWVGKEWPAPGFAALARRLTGPGGILAGGRVAILGATGERAQAEPVIAAVPPERLIDLVGRVDLPTAAACLRRSALYVGNDSGLMHVAAATGVPTLGLFGPSRESQYAPWGPCAAWVRTPETFAELTGTPGYDSRRVGSLMGSLEVETVAVAATALFERAEGRAA